MRVAIGRTACLLALLWVGACAPAGQVARAPERVAALPPVPKQTGPLALRLAYPTPGATRPDVDSTFVFGETGTGEARLWINGLRIPVAANGAFLAYVPVPRDGVYRLAARAGRQEDTLVFAYTVPPPPRPNVEAFAAPRWATVTGGKDTLATGSEIASAAPTPTADRHWFFPRGARLVVTGRLGDQLRVRLTSRTEAWIAAADVALADTVPPPPAAVGAVTATTRGRHVDLRLGTAHAPFLVTPGVRHVDLTLYGRTAPPAAAGLTGDFIRAAGWTAAPDSVNLRLDLGAPLWGFKAFYEADGTLVLRLRRPPALDAGQPLRGVRILVDAGHPPGGAIGPTGLTEADANLAIATRLAALLRARGAEVLMTRTSPAPLKSATSVATELWGRVDLAVAEDADLLVSVHNNAFPDGVNPFEHHGTETYFFYPFSQPLAEALAREIAGVTGLRLLGAKQRSLALVRPSWMPSTLTESLFMMFPQQEAALRDPAFLDRLAAAHLRGIEAFLKQAAGR